DSNSTNLDPADAVGIPGVFVRDLQTGTTTLASRATGAGGASGDSNSSNGVISGNGRFVAFDSIASNLSPDQPADLQSSVFVLDLQTNTPPPVSSASGAHGAAANSTSFTGAISPTGRFVAFASAASNPDPASSLFGSEVYVRDLQTNPTTLVSRASGAAG